MHAKALPEKRSAAMKSKAYKAIVIVLGAVLVAMGGLVVLKSIGVGGPAALAGGAAETGSELGPGAAYEDFAGDPGSDGQAPGSPEAEAN